MQIQNLSFYLVNLPFRFAFKHSLASRSYSQNVIVKASIQTDNGQLVTGFGEGIPREYVTGETIEHAPELLTNTYFPCLIGQHSSNALQLVIYLTEQIQNLTERGHAPGAIWCAVETALLDAACKAEGISVSRLMNESYAPKLNTSIKYGAVVPFAARKALIALLLFYKVYGFSTVKLKVGSDLKTDVENVRLARLIMGNDCVLRVDANCAWSRAGTVAFAEAVQAYNVASIEQPLKPDDLEGLRRLSDSIPQAIVLDESLCTAENAKEYSKSLSKVEFNIRVSKVGGLITARAIHDIAREAGIRCHLGAQVGESGVLTAANQMFAFAQGPFVNCEGAANLYLLKDDLTRENLTFGYGGIVKLPVYRSGEIKPGLGITVDETKLMRFTEQGDHVLASKSPGLMVNK